MPYNTSKRRSYGSYKGKKKYSGRKKGSLFNSGPRFVGKSGMGTKPKAFDELQVYRDPFSTATTNPKIPDGKATHSCGLRLQAVREWVNGNSGNTTMEFLLFPGISNGLSAWSVGTGVYPDDATDSNNSMAYTNHAPLVAFDNGTEGGALSVVQPFQGRIVKWRMVSQAARFTLINNSDENDGWWEAVRVQLTGDEPFDLIRTKASKHEQTGNAGDTWFHIGSMFRDDPNNGNIGYNDNLNNEVTYVKEGNPIMSSAHQMVEHPTYVTGKLRDLHRYSFQLKPQGSDHEFITMNEQIVNSGMSYAFEPGIGLDGIAGKHMRDRGDAPDITKPLMDTGFDAIFIRVHGRPGGVAGATRIMAHVVANQELIYDESSTYARFHNGTNNTPLFDAVKASATADVEKAGKKRQRTDD